MWLRHCVSALARSRLGARTRELMRAAATRGLDLCRPLAVSRESGNVGEALPEALQQLLVEWRLGRAEAIETPEPLLAHLDQSRPTQVVEVVGRLCLRHLQNGDEIANTKFPVLQDVENSEAGPVRKSSEHLVDAGSGSDSAGRFICIHVCDYSLASQLPQVDYPLR
jgi:hypothetical protein